MANGDRHSAIAASCPTATALATTAPTRLGLIYLMEALCSISSNLLFVGIFFFMKHQYAWEPRDNFALAASQGVAYVLGALLADRISRRLGKRKALSMLWLVMALAAAGAGVAMAHPLVVAAMLIVYAGASAAVWPQMESITAAAADPHLMSRRVGTYNLIWAGVGAPTVLCSGMLIEYFPVGVFCIAAGTVALCAALMFFLSPLAPEQPAAETLAALAPDPRLLHQRTLALWLSRICMPALYVTIYSIAAVMPSLPTIKALGIVSQTVVGSLWMFVRVFMFLALGATVWWHGRPRVMLVAALFILLSCVAIPFRPSDAVPASFAADVTWLVFWQVVMGMAQGMIYTASLYFGMVLSEASTEHGGYHEALIGLGSVIGPGAAALAAALYRGNLWAGMTPVAIIMGASVAAACVASIRLRRRDAKGPLQRTGSSAP